jgi:PhnB protein
MQTQAMQTQVYLFFDGRCDEALDFYKKNLGVEVEMLMRFKDAPEPKGDMCAPGNENKVMHSCFKLGDWRVMASDGRCEGKPNFQGFALSLSVKDEAEADRVFGALGQGGQVQMPLTKTFFSPKFGMVADKFGVGWMVLVASES